MAHYVCTVGFETERVDKEGKTKIKRTRFLVEGDTLYEGLMNMIEYLKGDSRGYDIKAITEAKYEEIVKEQTPTKGKSLATA